MDSVTYNNKQWPIKTIYVDGEMLSVASEKLEEHLKAPDGEFIDDEAKRIDDMIFCYVPTKKFGKADNVLHNYIVKNFF